MPRPDPAHFEQLLVAASERARGVRIHLLTTMDSALEADAVLQARLFNQILTEVSGIARTLQSARLDAVLSLREQGYSYEDIARILDVSKARAQQLVASARRRADAPRSADGGGLSGG
ncbi:MAG: hypothetical protein WD794_07715 [Mycobacteriales bacterium]